MVDLFRGRAGRREVRYPTICEELGLVEDETKEQKYELRAEYLSDGNWRPYIIIRHHDKEELEEAGRKLRSKSRLYNANENRVRVI